MRSGRILENDLSTLNLIIFLPLTIQQGPGRIRLGFLFYGVSVGGAVQAGFSVRALPARPGGHLCGGPGQLDRAAPGHFRYLPVAHRRGSAECPSVLPGWKFPARLSGFRRGQRCAPAGSSFVLVGPQHRIYAHPGRRFFGIL